MTFLDNFEYDTNLPSPSRRQPHPGGRRRRSLKEEELHEMLEWLLQVEEIF